MKKPRDAHINSKKNTTTTITTTTTATTTGTNSSRKSFYELSLSLIFSFWCLFILFYSRFGHSHGGARNADSSYMDDGSNNSTIGLLLQFNLPINSNASTVHDHNYADFKYSPREAHGLEVVWNLLGYTALECKVHTEEQKTNKPLQYQRSDKASHSTYLDLDEFRNKTMQEKGGEVHYQLGNITHRLEPGGAEYNYASAAKGAKVLAHNKEAKGASNILGKDQDKYLRNPCSAEQKFVVIELSEETLVDAIKIANFEHHSSNFKDIELSSSLNYPTDTWNPLGKFVAANIKQAQKFMLSEPKWVRYLRLNLLSHYGSEFYCTVSVLEVYGVDAIERMLEDLIVVSEERSAAQSSNSNTLGTPSGSESDSSTYKDGMVLVQNGVYPVSKVTENIDDGQKLNLESTKKAVLKRNVPDPVMEVRQQQTGRIPGDTVLKILMQKMRSLELNLTVLQEYIKELNRRYSDIMPELDKELSRNAMLLEKANSDIKDLMEWREVIEIGAGKLESWKSVVSSQINELVKENSLLRLEVDKVLRDQAILGNKELAVLAVSFFFACVAVLKLVSERVVMLFQTSKSENFCRTSRGWILILVSSSMTTLITLLYN